MMQFLKKNSKFFTYMLFLVAVSYVFYQMYILKEQNINLYNKTKFKENIIAFQESTIEELFNKEFLIYQERNTRINNTIIYINDKDSCLLKELLCSTKIIFHYSSLSCLDCVNQEIGKIKSLSNIIGKSNVIILASYNNKRELLLFKRVNGLVDNLVYRINKNSTGLLTDSLNISSLMIIDSSLIIKEIFFPDVNYPEASDRYYDLICTKYFLKSTQRD